MSKVTSVIQVTKTLFIHLINFKVKEFNPKVKSEILIVKK